MNIFHRIAGADRNIIQDCSDAEKVKITGYGTFVIIPALLGFISMSYALSTFIDNQFISIVGGIIWFFIIFAIDRFIVSTLYKSTINDNKGFWFSALIRIIFAFFVGLAVSHPIVLLFFDGTINEVLGNDKIELIDKSDTKYDNEIAEIEKKIAAYEKTAFGFASLVSNEQNGTGKTITIEFYDEIPKTFKASLKARCGEYCKGYKKKEKEYEGKAKEAKQELTDLKKKLQPKIDESKNLLISNFSEEYVKRAMILKELEEDEVTGSTITLIKWFLIIFFVFVDMLPVIMKISTPSGEYEIHRDTQIKTTRRIQEELQGDFIYNSKLEEYKTKLKMREIAELSGAPNILFENLEKERKKFAKISTQLMDNIAAEENPELRKDYLTYFKLTRDIWLQNVKKSFSLLTKFFTEN